ncbi:MAG: protein-glutamate O-methyltransferase CheR [Gammaproteobacteria bacterium]|nr:protein-glutamate O-methyltransferase CheR [Gammaproteobacteria bacterium]MBQ0839147.1 protein-glutamate O-methyltransferase CheR [Gammaproteobacteria bacterium]
MIKNPRGLSSANIATGQDEASELQLSDRQYRLWAEMLENKTGVRIAAHRDDFVRRQIVRRVNELGFNDVEDYFREVAQPGAGNREWGVLLDRLLVKESQFFRHQASHDFFKKRLLSHLLSAQQGQRYSVCSIGCSTGEEVYSLAMAAFDSCRAVEQTPAFSIVGIDVSAEAIQAARRGIYPNRHLQSVPEPLRDNYFTVATDSSMEVKAELKKRVGFFVSNMFDQNCPGLASPLDVIFCQNVLIYLKNWRRRDLLNSFVEKLKPGGYLIVGPGELNDWQPEGLSRVAYPGIQAFEKLLPIGMPAGK